MPLFGRKSEPTSATIPPAHQNPRTSVDSNHRQSRSGGGLFSRRRSNSSISSSDLSTHRNSHGHGRTRNRTSTSHSSSNGGVGGGLSNIFHRNNNNEDPSIVAARQRVMAAEQAERDADAALIQARNAVNEAKEHVRLLEREAEEEARLAKIKQGQARDLGKRAKPLGRKYF